MLKMPYDEIVGKIKEKSGLSEDEIRAKVETKVKTLSGLVSREGAAHILANELGIRVFEQISGKLEIKNILSGMRDVEVFGKIMTKYDSKAFNANGREGKVGSLQIADKSGQIRIVLWNNQADLISTMKVGDIVKIKGGYVRERNNFKEVHLNERGKLTLNPEGETIDIAAAPSIARKQLSDLAGTEGNVEILATVVQVFEPRYFEVCGTCGKRARTVDGITACDSHGAIKAAYSYVLNAFIDDGTENLRAVFFREQAQRLLNKTNEKMLEYKDNPELFEEARNEILGSNVKIVGRASKNDMFDRLEFVAQRVELNPDPKPEIKKLEEELASLRQNKQ